MKKLAGVKIFGVILCGGLLSGCAWGQTHKVEKPESVVRAVGVYEWTGDMAKPAASRLIPVTVYIDGALQDAGVYLARPVPFALDTGNVYELQQAGVPKGLLDLRFARHLHPADSSELADGAYDDGWFGYGSFQALKTPKVVALKPSKTLAKVKGPHLDTKASADADRPTMKQRGTRSTADSGAAGASTTTAGETTAPVDDPDRPVMHRRTPVDSDEPDAGNAPETKTDDASAKADTGVAKSGENNPADDPDRPTLKRHTPEDGKKAKRQEDTASVSGIGQLLNDPDRPTLHRGKPASAMTEADLPKLTGLPVNLKQMVAVSDAATREVHDFSRAWTDAAEKAGVLAKMEALARAQLAAYAGPEDAAASGSGAVPDKATDKAATKAAGKWGTKAVAGKGRRGIRKAAAPAPVVALEDEELKGYLLSYGGEPAYVFMAHTAGMGAELRYVTVVAQQDAMGELKPAIQSVTDAAHLDRTPRMKLVDAVDAEASNRASLLFELREQGARQFALYRVIGGRAEQVFLSGTTQ